MILRIDEQEVHVGCGATDDEIRLNAWIVTDGWVGEKYIQISQNAGEKADSIRDLLKRMDITFSERIKSEKGRKIRFAKRKKTYTSNADHLVFSIAKGNWANIKQDGKYIPQNCVRGLSRRQFDIYMETLIDGDRNRPHDGTCRLVYRTNIAFMATLTSME